MLLFGRGRERGKGKRKKKTEKWGGEKTNLAIDIKNQMLNTGNRRRSRENGVSVEGKDANESRAADRR